MLDGIACASARRSSASASSEARSSQVCSAPSGGLQPCQTMSSQPAGLDKEVMAL